MLVAFLILFYTVESLIREWRTGLAPIYYSTPVRTAAFLAGKAFANAIVGVAILLACYLGASLVMAFQGSRSVARAVPARVGTVAGADLHRVVGVRHRRLRHRAGIATRPTAWGWP